MSLSNDNWMDERHRIEAHESAQDHAGCLDEMLHGIAQVAVEYLNHYKIGVPEKDIVDWLEGVRDGIMDNLLWREWGEASDYIPADRRAHCETALREARKWFEQKKRNVEAVE